VQRRVKVSSDHDLWINIDLKWGRLERMRPYWCIGQDMSMGQTGEDVSLMGRTGENVSLVIHAREECP
jgi:hypothetical protein